MKWVRYSLRETASKGRQESMDSCRIDVSKELGRYVATGWDLCSVATWRPSLARARSLRSDRVTFFGLFSDVLCFFRRALHIDSVLTDFDPNNYC
ncbi:hypothetical protein F2Q68_00041066 [Brassica cretica]|uniref:Uncharacterized protein n=1 Tax=Brassica cretica TaxID=69181 RepID=A0A8S9MAX2_BRACR|nr:hypothetical protein F2Q68_00041066 [Brassica cretica]